MKRENQTILIAEDSVDDQILLKRAFKKNGIVDLQVVSDGAQAIEYLDGEGKYSDREQFPFPSILITDLKMPFADGFQVLSHINSNPEWVVIPIVLSASSDMDDIKKAYLVGAKSYLVKPSDSTQLDRLIKKLYDYWIEVEVPQIVATGHMKKTESAGKLGERISQP
ncbi:MAG: response regulator receiver protein [Verrucomicrobiales bacterium]|nr:response regulator receiver protein [Verrucomicrobiales bacterium]